MKIGNLLVNAAYLGSKALTAIAVGATKVWEGVSKYIKFKDPVVERLCAQKWGDGIGITLAQAKSVNDLGRTFQNTEITSFTELPMFGIDKIGEYEFYYCQSLSEITLFEGITKIEQRAFAYDTSLKELYIPKTLAHVSGQHAFSNVKLDKLIVGGIDEWMRIKVDGESAAYTLPNLSSNKIIVNGKSDFFDYVVASDINEIPAHRLYKFPIKMLDTNNVKTISTSAMQYSSVERVVLRSVDTLKTSAFQNCTSLEHVEGIENVTSLADRAFVFCSKLANAIKINPRVLEIKEYTFGSCNKVPYFDFREHVSVPSLTNANGMPSSSQIVVPDSLYYEWIAATNWSTYASRIVKASEFVEPTNNE